MNKKAVIVFVIAAAILVVAALFVMDALRGNNGSGTFLTIPVGGSNP